MVGAPFWTVSTSSMGTGDREICCTLREWNTLLDTSRIVFLFFSGSQDEDQLQVGLDGRCLHGIRNVSFSIYFSSWVGRTQMTGLHSATSRSSFCGVDYSSHGELLKS